MPRLVSDVRSALGRLIQWEEEQVDDNPVVQEETISPDEDAPDEVDFKDIVADFAKDDDEDDDEEDDSGDNTWVGRRVFGIVMCYYIMTRRYICSH